ncbi:MAG TPA: hypothetical protein VI818_05895 [Candidatus Thermoplasmatota archaeon]|nr:hypothetical protein [Candidatus Thermoplasmatota archaeon]
MPRRWLWFWLLLAVSVGITVVGTIVFHNPFLALFLFLPFGPWMFRRRASDDAPPRAVCPRCGRPARASDDRFCPHDGEPLPRP